MPENVENIQRDVVENIKRMGEQYVDAVRLAPVGEVDGRVDEVVARLVLIGEELERLDVIDSEV